MAIGTVSRYLNGLPVRPGNRDQIETAIQRLGYRRNALAAAMKTDLTNTVGFMVPDAQRVPLRDARAAEPPAAHRRAAPCSPTVTTTSAASISDALDFFAAHRVDCLVMDGHEEAADGVRELLSGGTPVIFYDNDVPGLPVDRVLVENRAASARAVGHLLDIGHTRIAVLAGSTRNSAGRERLEGYLQAMRDRGVAIEPEYVVDAHWTESRGYAGMLRLLSLEHPPTARLQLQLQHGGRRAGAAQGARLPHSGRHLAGQLRRRAAVQPARRRHHRGRPADRQDRRNDHRPDHVAAFRGADVARAAHHRARLRHHPARLDAQAGSSRGAERHGKR